MYYAKPPLTFEEQAQKLIQRGLIADADEIVKRLKSVNYYRLSAYLYPFRNPDVPIRWMGFPYDWEKSPLWKM